MTEESYNDIGQLLKTAREEQGLELDAIAQALHIRVRYLDALECGRLSDLPGISYTKGYLQVYAGFVGLDKDEILRRFEEVETMLGRRNFYLPQVFHQDKTPNRAFIWGGVAAAVFAYLFWLAVLSPSKFSISLVEPFSHVSASVSADVACLNQSPTVLYPPCTMARPVTFNLVSLQARIKIPVDPQQIVEK